MRRSASVTVPSCATVSASRPLSRLRAPARTPVSSGSARALDRLERRQSEARERRRPEGDAHDVDLVLVRIVARRVEAFVAAGPAERLRHHRAVGTGERHRPGSVAQAGLACAGRPDEDVAAEPGQVRDHDRSAPGSGNRVPQHQSGRRLLGVIPSPVGIVADQRVEAGAGHLACGLRDIIQPPGHSPRDGVGGTAPDRVVELRAHQRAPGVAQQRAAVAGREGGQRLGDPLEQQLGLRVAPLERRAGAVHALERPGVPVRPAQLAAQRRYAVRFGRRRAEELVQPGYAHLGVGLQAGQEIAHPVDAGRRRVMVRAHRHRELGRGRPPGEHRAEARPRFGERTRIVHQARARFVSVRRQMMQQDGAAVGRMPAVEVALLAGFAAQPAPQHTVRDAELGRERGPDGGMPERVGRVQHVRPAAEPLGVGPPEEQVAKEGLAGRDELVGEDVPRPDLQPPVAHEAGDPRALLGADAQVVLQQHGLAVEEEAAESGCGVETVEQVVDGGDQAGHEGGAGEIPLPVPVGVRDEMDGEPGHRIASQYSERRNNLTAIRSTTSARST